MNQIWDRFQGVHHSELHNEVLFLSREKLREYLGGSSGFESAIGHLLAYPGKHLRTHVTVGWGLYCDSRELLEILVESALGIELIHEGSLVHDDVYDQSAERRDQSAIYNRFGLRSANNLGLYLIARGVSLLCRIQDEHNIRLELPQISQLASSQVMETLPPCDSIREQQDRMVRMTDGKTGVLFSLASALGAALASAKCRGSDEMCRAKRFGEIIGRAYQIRDDIAEFSVGSGQGGLCGSDMVAGNWNWPTMYWARQASNWHEAVVRIESCRGNPHKAAQLAEEVMASGALDMTEKALARELRLAAELVDQSPPSPGRELLSHFIDRLELP